MVGGDNIGRWADEIHIGIVSIIPGHCSQVTPGSMTWEPGIVTQMSCDEVDPRKSMCQVFMSITRTLILLGIFFYLLQFVFSQYSKPEKSRNLMNLQ